jgi:hypothetical protein
VYSSLSNNCLLLNDDNESPYDTVVCRRPDELDVVVFLQATTTNSVLAFLVCAHQMLITVPTYVMTHIRQVLPGLSLESSSVSYINSSDSIPQALNNHETLKTLLRNDELQILLKEEDCLDLIRSCRDRVPSSTFEYLRKRLVVPGRVLYRSLLRMPIGQYAESGLLGIANLLWMQRPRVIV